jgi:hypothetical protein
MKKLLYLLLLTGCAGSVPNTPVVAPTCNIEACQCYSACVNEADHANRREFSSPIPIDPNDHFGHPYP